MSGISHARRERKQHEQERNFVRMPHRPAMPPPTKKSHNRSSIVLPQFHGVSFRILGKQRRAVYHQLDGSIELADRCSCLVHFSESIWGWPDFRPMWVERMSECPIDEHRFAANRARTEDAA